MPPGTPGGNEVNLTLKMGTAEMEAAAAKAAAIIDDLRKQAAGSVNFGGGAGAGAPSTATSAAGTAAGSSVQTPTNPGRGASAPPPMPKNNQRIGGAAMAGPGTATYNPNATARFPSQPPPGQPTMSYTPAQAGSAGYGMPGGAGGYGGGSGAGGFGAGGGQFRGSMGANAQLHMRLQGGPEMFLAEQAAYAMAGAYSAQMNYNTQRFLKGGDDPMARASMHASNLSNIIGLSVGLGTANPWLGMAAQGLSNSVIDPAMRWLAAPQQAQQDANLTLLPYYASRVGQYGKYAEQFETGKRIIPGGGIQELKSRLQKHVDWMNNSKNLPPELRISPESSAQTLAGLNNSLIEAGIDPEGPGERIRARFQPFNPFGGTSASQDYAASAAYMSGRRSSGLSPFDAAISKNLGDLKSQQKDHFVDETLAETYKRRLELMLGKESVAGQKRIGPMFDQQYGSNIADLALKFGVNDTMLYERTLDPQMKSPVSEMELANTVGAIHANNRRRTLIGLQPRDKGTGLASVAMDDMNVIGALPGGRDSVAYAEANAQRRSATMQAFHEQDTVGYEMPMDALRARSAIAQYLPYSPGRSMGFAMETLSRRAPQIATETARYRSLMAMGDLSEDQQRSMRQHILSMQVEQAQDIGMLAEGGPNRMTAMFAGMPSRRGRFDSLSMARTAAWHSGTPRRDMGFANGSHLSESSSWFNSFGVNVDPFSRTAEINSPMAQGRGSMSASEIPALLKSIDKRLSDMQRGTGTMSNPGQGSQVAPARNRQQDALNLGNFDTRRNYGNRG